MSVSESASKFDAKEKVKVLRISASIMHFDIDFLRAEIDVEIIFSALKEVVAKEVVVAAIGYH